MTTNFNNVSYADTGTYYKQRAWDYAYQYNLSYNPYPESGHNDEVDAFRHTFMEAMFTYKYNSNIAKTIGDIHEKQHPNELSETVMDLWNNSQGREIGEALKTDPNIAGMTYEQIEDYVAQKVYEKLLNGDLITDINDSSQFNKNFDLEFNLNDDLLNQASSLVDQAKNVEMSHGRYDPIVFDLDGDGLETTTIEDGVYFDHANDGFAESSAWVGEGDGILAIDTDANGTIDNGTELVLDHEYLKVA